MKTQDPERRVAFALADATRLRVLRHIEASSTPVPVAELAAVAGTSTQAVRRHLGVLVDAGLAAEEVEHRTSRGRPRLLYRATTSTPARAMHDIAGEPGPYERLAVLQATGRRTRQAPHLVGRAYGVEVAASRPGEDAVAAVAAVMAREGFSPSVEPTDDPDVVDVVLGTCPFAAAAAVDPAGVCQLHVGIAEGIVGAIGGAEVAGVQVHDPNTAGCRLRLRRTEPHH